MTDFDKIVEYATNCDTDSLKALLATGVSIDVQGIGHFSSPAETLASSRNIKAAEFLREHGANINKIARGYARACVYDKIEYYSLTLGADNNDIAQGYAMAKDYSTADSLRQKYGADPVTIGFGFAFAGDVDRVQEYQLVHRVPLQVTTQGYVLGGHDTLALINCDDPQINVNQIAKLFAFMGKHEAVDALRNHPRALAGIQNDIAKGYAQSGNHEKVEAEIARGAHIDFIARGYAEGGHYREAYSRVTNMTRNTEFIANGLSDGDHLDTLKEAMRAIVFIENVTFRDKLMDHLFLLYPELNAAMPQIERMRDLMNPPHSLNYDEALFVSDPVREGIEVATALHAERHLVPYRAASAMAMPEIQMLILQCAHQGFFSDLPFAMIGEIAHWLTPYESKDITKDLREIAFDRHEESLTRDLTRYQEPSFRTLFHFYKRTARQLIDITNNPELSHNEKILALNEIYDHLPAGGRNRVREIIDAHKGKFKL